MTQIGFVGLGKMGGNMVHRIRRDSEHEVVGFARSERSVGEAVKNGATAASSLRDLVKKLEPPRRLAATIALGNRSRASSPITSPARFTNSSKNAQPYSASIASNCSMST